MNYLFFLDNLKRDFLYAIRSIRKDWKFAFVAVFTLALGIGASSVMFSVVTTSLVRRVPLQGFGKVGGV